MTQTHSTGLGEVLRHLIDLIDKGSQDAYQKAGIEWRPRYTPVMRALDGDPVSVTTLMNQLRITQGAISQTVKLMEADQLIKRVATGDNRSRAITLTPKGMDLRGKLVEQWQLRFAAISELEAEIDAPLRSILTDTIRALEREGFADRIARLGTGDSDD